MEFEQFYNSLPKFSRFYMISVFVVTFCISYVRVPLVSYLLLDIDSVTDKFQFWRLFTNFFIVGKFSFNFVFYMMMIYNTLTKMEKKAVETKKYAEFVMLLVYTLSFVLVVSLLLYYIFGFELKAFLSFEMLFALIYIEAKRDPEKMVMVWFMTVKNAYVPWVLTIFSMITGGDIVSDLVGIAAGHLYFFFKDLAPLNLGWDFLKTPQFLINFFDRVPNRNTVNQQPQATFRTLNNQNTGGSFGTQSQSSASSFRQEGNEGSGNRFQPFGGRGQSWG